MPNRNLDEVCVCGDVWDEHDPDMFVCLVADCDCPYFEDATDEGD